MLKFKAFPEYRFCILKEIVFRRVIGIADLAYGLDAQDPEWASLLHIRVWSSEVSRLKNQNKKHSKNNKFIEYNKNQKSTKISNISKKFFVGNLKPRNLDLQIHLYI